MRIRVAFCALLAFLISCAPLKPLSPTSGKSRNSGETRTYVENGTITGIAEWDRVLFSWLGTPYLYGGTSKNGVDCSGFVSGVYAEKENMYIPRTTKEEFKQGMSVEKSELAVGDLVFFGDGGVVNHVGIYVGGGKMIHASSSQGVAVIPLSNSYWVPRYMGARRYL